MWRRVLVAMLAGCGGLAGAAAAEIEGGTEPLMNVRQIRVRGATVLDAAAIETAVYPYLGPGRTLADLEAARAALEQAHKELGYQSVAVEIPPQNGTRGIIFMDVVESRVGRLRVRGAKYFMPGDVKRAAPSLAEGKVPDFNRVQEEIVGLNKLADRRVTPDLRPGAEPGTVDVDLLVEDKLPLHGSIELNNRYSPETTELRLNGAISYNNLWQLGHSAGIAGQWAPERLADAEVYSAYYIARFAQAPDFSLMLSGFKQNSDVSTLGGAAVAGRGESIGIRGIWSLPPRDNFFHSLSAGVDYKRFDEDLTVGEDFVSTPIDYYPVAVAYGAGWNGDDFFTELNASVGFHLRGMGSQQAAWDAKRYLADGSYILFRGDVSHTRDLPLGFQIFGKLQGQASNDPLINTEQVAGGGASTVRGYLESEALGDSGWFVTAEIRSPSVFGGGGTGPNRDEPDHEWRFHGFVDGGKLYLNQPLPEQRDLWDLASVGIGTRILLARHFNGSFDLAWPLADLSATGAGDPFLSFRLWAEF
jgi:hemolysin activation/secretion protein